MNLSIHLTIKLAIRKNEILFLSYVKETIDYLGFS